MNIYKFELGPLKTNCYVLENNHEALVVDPGYYSDELLNFLDEKNLSPKYILLTHGHFDHIMGVKSLKEKYPDAKICISNEDAQLIQNPNLNGSIYVNKPDKLNKADILLKDNDILNLGELKISVIKTPGHTKGGVCYKVNDIIFCGDTLFYHSIGRTDLPGGNHLDIENSIKNKIYSLDENITLLTGHGKATSIKEEKQNNMFFNA